ncbi:GNAT family N-acetyltransferase [Sorangium sp. So ce1335]|uniref:GNAT family N-acetyltransferase n=1 Tax=Sorangium sp. So ce1335 TaxID=3133335 RepID=UPI003F5E59B3
MALFDPFPVLTTPRLRLRALGPGDAERVFRLRSDPEVTRYLGRAPDSSLADAEQHLAVIREGIRTDAAIYWGITRKESGELVGTGGFWRWNKPHRWAEIGYGLLPELWGQGIMTEALGAMLPFGFESMDLHRVEAQLDPENRASARLLERLGFAREGQQRQNWYHEGRFTDTAVYGLLRGELKRGELKAAAT